MSSRTEQFIVEKTAPGGRLDAFLRERFPDISRGAFQRLISEGHVTVNAAPTKAAHQPRAGEIVRIEWPDPRPADALPEEIPLEILYEDADLLVINKPPGIVVHPAAGNEEHTLVNALLHHCAGALSGIGGVARPGIVHRLDKDTSGCLLAAKNDAAHTGLAGQFEARTIRKVYHAIVCGIMTRDEGEIRAAIARHPSHRKRMAVLDGGGREAWTSYRVIKRLNGATRVEAILRTGRTHQIRVHFKHLGFPLAGDLTYGRRQNKHLEELTGHAPPRQMLHAREIGFRHPRTGKELLFQAPLPADFEEAVREYET